MNTDLYGNLLLAVALLVISAVVVPLFAERRKLAGWLNFLVTAVSCSVLLSVSYAAIFGAPTESSLIHMGPFSIYFLLDGFSGFFLAVIAFMAIISAFYSIEYMEHYGEYGLRSYYLNFPLFVAGMALIVTVDDLTVGFTVAWQLMTIASYFLVKFEHRKAENVRIANTYLILMELDDMRHHNGKRRRMVRVLFDTVDNVAFLRSIGKSYHGEENLFGGRK